MTIYYDYNKVPLDSFVVDSKGDQWTGTQIMFHSIDMNFADRLPFVSRDLCQE